MKQLLGALVLLSQLSYGQNLQLHYNPRQNFPVLYFEYYKGRDSGAFLIKTEAGLSGNKGNIGKFYTQVSQSFRFWKPKIFLQLQYSGGLGIAEPGSYPYYISNAFSLGVSHPFKWNDLLLSVYASYTYTTLKKKSHDPLMSVYWYKGLFNYRVELSGDIEAWTLNKDQGDEHTHGQHGKRFYFLGQPHVWYRLYHQLWVGSKVNMYYHVLTNDDQLQVYPMIAIRYKFN